MEKLEIKRSLIEICKEKQQESINNIKFVMDDAQKSANEYGQPKDRYDSYRMQLLRKKDMFASQFQKAIEQMETLNKINVSKKTELVTFGSLIFTDDQNILVAISLGKIMLGDEMYYAISPNVPFYQAMQNCKKGDEFEFRGRKIKILDIV